MKTFDRKFLMITAAAELRRVSGYGMWDGRGGDTGRRYLRRCTGYHEGSGTVLIFTRDVGHHTSGWWKNPDYERCYHLSLSFRDPATGQDAPRDRKLTREWLGLFFGPDRDKLWCEPPYSPEGRAKEVWHYRLFCDPDWSPILPRGEVYSRELTEAGWKSYSDVRAELEAALSRAEPDT